MLRDETVLVLGEDVGVLGGAFGATKGLLEEFGPERVMDTPISESAICGVAMGSALFGLRPIAEMQFGDFISYGFTQIVNNIAKSYYRWGAKAPLVIRVPSGGGVHGGPFHSQNTEAWFFHTPGLKLVAPSTPYDAKGLLKAAVRDDNPVIYFENKYLYRRAKETLPEEDYIVEIGTGRVVRDGSDFTILTYSAMVQESLKAAEKLEQEGIDAEVVDLRSLLPYDRELILDSVAKTNRVLIVHEDTKTGGIGAELAAVLAEELFEYLDAPVRRVCGIDTPVPFSAALEHFFRPGAEKIQDAARELVEY